MSDNTLRDCLEELEDEELNQNNMIRDYKKLGRRKMVSLLMLSQWWVVVAELWVSQKYLFCRFDKYLNYSSCVLFSNLFIKCESDESLVAP